MPPGTSPFGATLNNSHKRFGENILQIVLALGTWPVFLTAFGLYLFKEWVSRRTAPVAVVEKKKDWHHTHAGIAFVDRMVREQRLADIINRYREV